MRVACLGGGPAGLYFAISMKLRDLAHEVVVFERNILAGNHALVTGGGSASARARARALAGALAGAGANVTIAGRTATATATSLAEVAGAETRHVTGDVTRAGDVRAMFDAASAGWGPPAIVVANAGARPAA